MHIKKKEILEIEKTNEYIKLIGAFINPSIASQLKNEDLVSESFDPFVDKTLEEIKSNINYGRKS